MIVLLMGVSGSGKTAVGRRLSERTHWLFIDGDDLHSESSRRKMAAGVPLQDEDRWPWLEAIRREILAHEEAGSPLILACSALKEEYRRRLLESTREVRLVHLRGDPGLIAQRLAGRRGHFFDPALLVSQFETLEEPADALVVSVADDLEAVTAAVAAALGLSPGSEEE